MTLILLSLGLFACRRSDVATYRIPKEDDIPAPAAAPASPHTFAVAPAAAGDLQWTAPADWRPKPATAMRRGSFDVGEAGGPVADLSITAFPGDVGGNLANVNRWRGQLQLPPIAEGDLDAALVPVPVAGLDVRVVDLAGGAADSPQRLLGAIVPFAGTTWFFKLTGPDARVAQEKPVYLEFLRTLKAVAPPAAAASPAPVEAQGAGPAPPPPASDAALHWIAPAGWQEKPATAMRKATYLIPTADGSEAELAISAFPGDAGGELANVSRWRGQLQLPPLAAAEIPGAVTRLTVHGLPVVLVDLAGGPAAQPQRLLGAIVPHAGATWFFKLTGPVAVVTDEKAAFLEFVQTLSAP